MITNQFGKSWSANQAVTSAVTLTESNKPGTRNLQINVGQGDHGLQETLPRLFNLL